jgi:hypothetical protein
MVWNSIPLLEIGSALVALFISFHFDSSSAIQDQILFKLNYGSVQFKEYPPPQANEGKELIQEWKAIIEEMGVHFNKQFNSIKSEIDQVRQRLRDAIGRLTFDFKFLEAARREQHSLVMS